MRDCRQLPFLSLAPVVKLTEPIAGEARKGHRPRFIPIPGLGDECFANLDNIITAEKSVLLGLKPKRGLPDDQSQHRFGNSVARVFGRFAFPDDLHNTLRKMAGRIKKKHAHNSFEGRALETLEEIRITGVPSWQAEKIDVFISFSPATKRDANNVMSDEEWYTCIEQWLKLVEPQGVIKSVDGAMNPLDQITARQYIDSQPLDLDYLSWPSSDTM